MNKPYYIFINSPNTFLRLKKRFLMKFYIILFEVSRLSYSPYFALCDFSRNKSTDGYPPEKDFLLFLKVEVGLG